jgi:hypothetical protein
MAATTWTRSLQGTTPGSAASAASIERRRARQISVLTRTIVTPALIACLKFASLVPEPPCSVMKMSEAGPNPGDTFDIETLPDA